MKIIKIIGFLLFLSFLSIELYWYVSRQGNLILFVQSESAISKITEIKIELNGTQIYDGKLVSNEIIPQKFNLTKRPGKHKLRIWRGDKNETIEVEFNLFFVKWVVVNLYSDDTHIIYESMPPLFQ